MSDKSALGLFYQKVYERICGRHPYQRPWLFQWLAVYYLHRDIQRALHKYVRGIRILDVGCGDKPYRTWIKSEIEYVGLDIKESPNVDIVVGRVNIFV